jgi:hypothetical protein
MPTQFNTPAETPAANASTTDLPEHLPEDAFQAASSDVPMEPKPKRKRNNDTRVRFLTLTNTSLTEHIHIEVKTTRVALASRYHS